ncbi:MAG: CRTAC1 family protein, partial [Candidatus Zixiibacteriota bacterium]
QKIRRARGVTAADYDEDGDLDIYVSNYRLQPNLLWQNDGRGTFRDVASAQGVAGIGDLGAWGHTIGSAWGDFDNDGHFDLFVGNFSHPPAYQDRPQFLRNLGPQESFRFADMSAKAGLRWQESYASPALADFDNDGLLDLYFTTVYPGDTAVLYRNVGKWQFKDVTERAKIRAARTYQAAWADYDRDGDLDLVTGGKLYRNPGSSHHWIEVRLMGTADVSGTAIGATVRVEVDGRVLVRQVCSATGQGNQNDATLHFGLGNTAGPIALSIRWPNGDEQEVRADVDRLVTVRYEKR